MERTGSALFLTGSLVVSVAAIAGEPVAWLHAKLEPLPEGRTAVVSLMTVGDRVRWKSKVLLPNASPMPLVVAAGGRTLALGVGDGLATAVDLATGETAWTSDAVGQNENQCILAGDRLIAHAMKRADREREIAAHPDAKVQEWAPGAVLSAPGADFGQVGCWRVTATGLEKLWVAPAEWGAPNCTPIGAVSGERLCFRGKYAYQIVNLADGSRIAKSYLSEPARMDEGHMLALPGLFVAHPDSQHGDTKFFPFPASADAKIAAMWRPPHPTATTYHVAMSHAWADGRLFIRGADAIYCYDLRRPVEP